jgi:transcriptional regulator with XRE-family HTH domain
MAKPPLSDMLWSYRTLNRLTMRDLGKMIGVSAATILRIETQGREMDSATLMKVLNWMLKTKP